VEIYPGEGMYGVVSYGVGFLEVLGLDDGGHVFPCLVLVAVGFRPL
jgi:hypothetical protein